MKFGRRLEEAGLMTQLASLLESHYVVHLYMHIFIQPMVSTQSTWP